MTANGLTIIITYHYITRDAHPGLVTFNQVHVAYDEARPERHRDNRYRTVKLHPILIQISNIFA